MASKYYVSGLVMLALLCLSPNAQMMKLTSQYGTNKQRTEAVKKYCSKPRSQMIRQEQSSRFEQYGRMTQTEIGINGDSAIKNLLQGHSESAFNQVRSSARIWIYFIFFIIGLVFLVISAPFLMCCCLCPDRCPPCIKCRHSVAEPYSNFQKCCPPFILIILSMIVIGCMIASLVWGVKMQKSYDQVQCSFAIFLDDALNGNSTADQNSYFIGLQPFKTSLVTFNTSLADIQQKLDAVSSNGSQISDLKTEIDQTKSNVRNIPDGSGGDFTLQYGSPFNTPIPGDKINSTFPQVLGNADTPLTLVGNASLGLVGASKAVQLVSKAADQALNSIPQYQTSLSNSISSVDQYINSMKRTDSSVDKSLSDAKQDYVRRIAIAFYIIVSALIVFGSVMMVSAACVCREKYACRKIMYFACFFLFILGILTFLLSLLFSAITFGSYLGCSYLKTGVSSPSQFQQYFNPIINDAKTAKVLSKCVPSGSGQIIQDIIGSEAYALFGGIGNVTTQLDNYDSTSLLQAYESSYSGLSKTIENYQRARTLDISSSSDDAKYLQSISNASNFACSAPGFTQDSWIPSVDQTPPYVACKIANGSKVTNSSCANFSSRDPGCVGCFDTYAVFEKNSSLADVSAALLARYPSADCTVFRTNLSNTWNNFYKAKKQVISPVLSRATAAQAQMSAIKTKISADISPAFTSTLSSLQSTYSSILDPKYGLLAGLNCRVLGEDVKIVIQVACNNLFVNSYLLRIMFIITSFSIVLIMMLAVCAGVRSVRSQNKYTPYSQEIGIQSEKANEKFSQGSKEQRRSGRSSERRRRAKRPGSSQELKHIQF